MRTLLAILVLAALPSFAQEPLIGTWQGPMVRQGVALPVSVTFARTGDGNLAATFSSPRQRALDIPLRNVKVNGDAVHFELVGDATTNIFDGKLAGDSLAGTFREATANGEFRFTRAAGEANPYRVEDARFTNGMVSLAGSLLVPPGKGPHAAVIFLHGSGAEGRAGSRFIADRFARAGIAALIYDKRGVGESTGEWRAAGFEELVGDAIAGIAWLRKRTDIRANHIAVYGHSQGGMLAPFVASSTPHVRYVISGAGSAMPLREAEVNSIMNQLRLKGLADSDEAAALEYVRRYVDALVAGASSPEFAAETEKVKNAPWFAHVHVPPAENWFWRYYARVANYNAADHWRKVTVPALVMYGEGDAYVPVERSVTNIDRALQQAQNRDYTIIVFPRATHAFDIVPSAGGPFDWPRVAPGFPELAITWLRDRVRG